ncbi:Nucleic acid-binding, OB-fold containing protein [Parasponia andersonii]|uniref:DNA-directed RNA polymerase subunit n=1 Tax=Parasponia andersonii TaxID=3476 RepID=A0A2P5DBY5_PARAD|nr:Nucleic acid-binding, OB-fold containing protein [Parasponia andersonii]
MEGLKVSDSNMVVYLHPSKSNKFYEAILRELSSLLFKFNENFDGVVLAYEFNILDKNAKILSGIHPYLAVRLKAKLLLFSPKPNMLLEGKVVKVTQGSIHVIVLGFSSAVIADEDIRNEFVYKTKNGEEVFSSKVHKRHVIKVGTMIRFLVKSLDEEILHISGSLAPYRTGSIHWLANHLEDVTVTDRSKKKRREEEEESVLQDHGTVSVEALSINNHHRSKKSKEKRRRADS